VSLNGGVELKGDAIKDVKPVRRRRDPRPASRAAAFGHPHVELTVASFGRQQQQQQQGERSKLAALLHDALEAPVARGSHFEVLGPEEPARGLVGNPDVVPFRHPMDHPFDLDLLAHHGAVRGSSQTTCALAGDKERRDYACAVRITGGDWRLAPAADPAAPASAQVRT
jgi:hypothetical protein